MFLKMIFFLRIHFHQIFPSLGMVLFFSVLLLVHNHFVLLITISSRVRKHQDIVPLLPDLEDSQMESALLWSCLSIPKFSMNLSSKLHQGCDFLFWHLYVRGCIRFSWCSLVGLVLAESLFANLTWWFWYSSSISSCPSGFVSSWVQSTDLIIRILNCVIPSSPHLSSALELSVSANRPECSSLDNIDLPIRQHHLSRIVDQTTFNILTDTALDTRSKPLALSLSLHHAGNWLKVVPSKALGLHIQDRDFWLCLRYCLGVQMCQKGLTCPVCHVVTDGFGDHQVGCRGLPKNILLPQNLPFFLHQRHHWLLWHSHGWIPLWSGGWLPTRLILDQSHSPYLFRWSQHS